jgi:HSP90 family molecular chaperone
MNHKFQKKFSADINQLLSTVTDRLYSDKEVFIRELISNSIDACIKAKHYANKGDIEFSRGSVLIKINQEEGQLLFCDNGIGMTRLDLELNLSTIAYSGTSTNKESTKEIKDSLIGRFGLGFYSCFAVATKVEVWSKSYREEEGNIWISNGTDGYDIECGNESFYKNFSPEHGTQILITLKEEQKRFLNEEDLKRIIKTYTEYVPIDIFINDMEKSVNIGKVLWQKQNMKEEDHDNIFFQLLGGNGTRYISMNKKKENMQGDYSCVLYCASKEFLYPTDIPPKPSISIFVNNIFVYQDFNILPSFMRFVKGLVDITNAPLNVSRESLQDSKLIQILHFVMPTMFLEELINKKNSNKEEYLEKFWKQYSGLMKEGACQDISYRSLLLDTFLFESAQKKEMISLEEYIKNNENITEILYTTNSNSSQIEFYLSQNKDVLIMNEKIDSLWPLVALSYGNKNFISIDSVIEEEDVSTEEKNMLNILTLHLKGKVKGVKFSKNLGNSLCSFLKDSSGEDYKFAQFINLDTLPILGINRSNKVILKLISMNTENVNLKKKNLIFDCLYTAAKINDSEIDRDRYLTTSVESSIYELIQENGL